ncbi:ABC transporter ATP-binding protein [Bacillus pacificus]|uniref:ABC transporter ATP-binding protein n=1 Tax=Bacillus pacificus TaxID=2026187 RepID=UPI003D224252
MRNILFFMKEMYSFSGRIVYINLLVMVFVSILEGVGILLLIPLMSFIGIVSIGETNKTTALLPIIHFLQQFSKATGLFIILVVYIFIVGIQNCLQRNVILRDVKIQQGFIRQLRIDTYDAILHAKWKVFLKTRRADFINSLTSGLARISFGINLSLQLVAAIAFTVIQISFALWLSAKITVFVLFSSIFFAFIARIFIKKARMLGERTSELAQQYLAGTTDHLNGIKDIKSNVLEESCLMWFRDLTRKMVNEQIEYMEMKSSSQLLYKTALAILVAVFIFLFTMIFDAHSEELLLIVLIFYRLWPRFIGIQSNLEQIAASIPAFQNLIDLRKECQMARELIIDSYQLKYKDPLVIETGLECHNVYFRYAPPEGVYVLQNINVQIPSNHMIAIVGRSGAGKSTLVDIITGFMEPERGQILIDGTPLTLENVFSFRQAISYVSQEPFLFNTSIRENLLMFDSDASEEQIWDALEFAAAAEFVKGLPQGLDTCIGDRGFRISGGERQRIVLARAILKKPSILVLDEATSALDTENELKIQVALEKLKGKMTLIIIAHRLSTIRNADQVIVLDNGRIVQQGVFTHLMQEKKGEFNNLVKSQFEANV